MKKFNNWPPTILILTGLSMIVLVCLSILACSVWELDTNGL